MRKSARGHRTAISAVVGMASIAVFAGAAGASGDTTEPPSTEAEATEAAGTEADGTEAMGTEAGGTDTVPELTFPDDLDFDVTFVQGVIGDEFYVSMECGVQDAAADIGGITVDVQGPDAFDATLQNPILDSVIASGPDAILVAPNDVEASAGPLERAQDEGIEVILVDTVVNDESIGASRIASDNFGGGVAAADALAGLIGGEGKVMVINVNPGISTTDLRQQGFEEQIATYEDIEYIGTEFSNNEPARAAEIVTATLAANPDLSGIFATNLFSAQGTATGLLQAGVQGDVQIVGFDAGPAQVEQLEAGDVQALVMQKPYDIGYQGVQQAVLALLGEEVTPEIQTDFVVATADNMEDPEISQWFYRASCDE